MNGTFSVLMDAPGTVELEQVSLFPQETFNGRRNGLRKDLVQLLKDLKPGVLRFPGGCVAEGGCFKRCRPEAKSVVFAGGRAFKTSLPASSLTIIRAKK